MKRFQKGKERWDGLKGEAVKKKRVSEAGNRTPVVRVTGGNTKPLYYFGTVESSNLFSTTTRVVVPLKMNPKDTFHKLCAESFASPVRFQCMVSVIGSILIDTAYKDYEKLR
jgi:hypothetical protein